MKKYTFICIIVMNIPNKRSSFILVMTECSLGNQENIYQHLSLMCLLKSIDYMFKILPVVSSVKVSLSKNFHSFFSQRAVVFFFFILFQKLVFQLLTQVLFCSRLSAENFSQNKHFASQKPFIREKRDTFSGQFWNSC